MKAIPLISAALLLVGCSDLNRAKYSGGEVQIEISAGQKLVSVSWDDRDKLWYLTRAMRPDEVPEVHTFNKKSPVGDSTGKVVFKESK